MPLRHGHAISIDMAYSATLAHMRGNLPDEDYKRLLDLFSRIGLSMDHEDFNEDILDKATTAILKTRDGKLRAAIPSPLGSCVFLNDVEQSEMNEALRKHKEICKTYPRNGLGLEAFVDSSDTGYTLNNKAVDATVGTNGHANGSSEGLKKINVINDDTKQATTNGTNGHANGNGVAVNGVKAAKKAASGPEGVDGLQTNGVQNGANGHLVNGTS